MIYTKREFIYTTPFRRAWEAMGLNDSDITALEEELLIDPQAGDVLEGTGGARKYRFKIGNRGKSSGGRVIYVDIFEKEHLYFLFAYPKSLQEDLTHEQSQSIRRMIEQIKGDESNGQRVDFRK